MKEKISERVSSLGYSVIRDMGQRAAAFEEVITLGIGEPDFHTPETISRRALEDAAAGHTHYTPSQGDPELLAALSEKLSEETGETIPPSRILVTHGGMGALAAVLRTLLEEGQEVLLPQPHFPDYQAHIAFAGGRVRHVATRFEEDFVLQPEALAAAVTQESKVLLLNSPCNPTGAMIPGETLDALAKIALEKDLIVVSDEVYDGMVYGKPFQSIATRPGMAERTVVIRSFSKTYAMTGWRVGYCYGPEWIIEQMLKVVNYSTACASSVGQRAALHALNEGPAPFAAMRDRFSRRVDLVWNRLVRMEGVRALKPSGTFYIFADISRYSEDSRTFALDLLEQEQVVVVPGYAFGPSGEGWIRIACTVDQARLATAMDRLERYLAGLKR